jgi:hypothetical protein
MTPSGHLADQFVLNYTVTLHAVTDSQQHAGMNVATYLVMESTTLREIFLWPGGQHKSAVTEDIDGKFCRRSV